MTRPTRLLLGLTIGVLAFPAVAQPPGFGRPSNPPVSPYLNLLNRRNTPAFNYYQLYRPQTEFRSAFQGLNQNLYQAESQIARQSESIEQIGSRVRPGSSLRTTGHTTSFMNYGRYFGTGNAASAVR